MSLSTESLVEQRQALRRALQAHREVLARQLAAGSNATQQFPRSHTLRLLSQRPAEVVRMLFGLVALLRRL